MKTFSRLLMFLSSPKPDSDRHYIEEARWVQQYQPSHQVPGELVLEHAQSRYRESVNTFEELGNRADVLVRTAGTLAMILVAAVAALDLTAGWPVRLSLACLLLSMLVAVWSRRTLDLSVQPRIRDVLEGSPKAVHPSAWLAASLHDVVEANRVINRWKARWIQAANILLCIAVGCLLPLVFCSR